LTKSGKECIIDSVAIVGGGGIGAFAPLRISKEKPKLICGKVVGGG
jgi:hypothetical protein